MRTTEIITTAEAESGFYPTPQALADILLEDICWYKVNSILEPSAGKGNLVESIVNEYIAEYRKRGYNPNYGNYTPINIDCIEIDPYLRSILTYEYGGQRQGELLSRMNELEEKRYYDYNLREYKGLTRAEEAEIDTMEKERIKRKAVNFHLVHDNFLTFDSRKHYSLIVMNPPFADGDAHLLKAIDLQSRFGGEIRCILNAETIRNPYTNRRKVLRDKLMELDAEITYVENAFVSAERQTDVEVAVIKVVIPSPEMESDIYSRLSKAAEVEDIPEEEVTDLTVTDLFEQIVTRFNVEIDAGIELLREYNGLKKYIDCLTLIVGEGTKYNTGSVNEFISLTRKKYWSILFSNKEFMGKLTTNLRTKYRNMVDALAAYDFTIFNIQQVAAQMNAEMNQGIQDTIVALFDKLTAQYAWYPEMQKNIHYFNGWKTNKAHKINNKVILPVNGMFSDYGWVCKGAFNVSKAEETISDIEKVFEYLDGNMTAPVDLHGVLEEACNAGQTRNIACKFFDVTLFKKGTMHLKFHDQRLLDRFNIYCSQNKKWLPPNYGNKPYTSLDAEEKAVVDGFHGDGTDGSGAAKYSEVMANRSYYLASPNSQVPLLGGGEA